ncbi:hypothetical protein BH10ACT1_BH10ACT1_08030 [soil metagenome]
MGYGYEQVAPFVRSIRNSGFRGPVVLILDRRLDGEQLARLEAEGVTPHLVWNNSWLVVANAPFSRLARLALRSPLGRWALLRASPRTRLTLQSATNRRFLLYADLLVERPELFAPAPWVFLTDVRDVYFQGNPADAFGQAVDRVPLHLFAEGPPPGHDQGPAGTFRIRQGSSTIGWIRGLAGDSVAEQLADERVICSGTILVATPSLPELSTLMTELMAPLEPGRSTFGFDQGALNLLHYTGRLEALGTEVHDNGTGDLLTLGAISHDDSWSFEDGRVSVAGTSPSVVHQYDRAPVLKAAWATGP